jgi:uncharacterized repeat protein (TIGR01451 family)
VRRKLISGFIIVGAALLMAPALANADVTFNVTTTQDAGLASPGETSCTSALDGGGCTLRAAIEAADNNTGQAVTISVPAGTYALSASNAEPAGGNELEVTSGPSSVSIVGAGAGSTTVDASYLDRAFQVDNGATATISGLTIEHGAPGGFGHSSSCSVEAGPAAGGGVLTYGALTLSGDVITGNAAPGNGGGVEDASSATVSVSGTTISDNLACFEEFNADFEGLGGGFDESGGAAATIDTSTIINNESQGFDGGGGGVAEAAPYFGPASRPLQAGVPHPRLSGGGSVTITNSTIAGNQATGIVGADGGGVVGEGNGTVSLFADTVNNNTASGGGGGVGGFDSTSIVDSTITANTASGGIGPQDRHFLSAPAGGGVENSSAPVTISFSTINDNTATNGGAGGNIANGDSASITLDNSIVTGGVGSAGTPDNCAGAVTSGGYNLFDDPGTSCGAGSSDLTNQAPLLGPLQNNGGPTRTEALLLHSPAIDAANDSACSTETQNSSGNPVDQRGEPRPEGLHCDIGAFEALPDTTLTTSVQKDPIFVGQQDTVTDVVTNNANAPAPNVVFTDPAAGFVIDSVTTSQGTCTHTATTIHCALGTVAPGASVTITIVVTGTSAGTITLKATVTMSSIDANPGHNTTTTEITVQPVTGPLADVGITVTASTKRSPVGRKFSYVLKVTNSGPDAAQSVKVTDQLPKKVKLVSVGKGASCSGKAKISCSLGNMAPNASTEIRLTVKGRRTGKAQDKAQVTDASPADPNTANNSAKATVHIFGKPSVTIAPIGVVCPAPGSPAQVTVTGKAPAGVKKLVVQLSGQTIKTYSATGKPRGTVVIQAPVSGSGLVAGHSYTVSAVITDTLGQRADDKATLTMCSGVPS